MMVRPHALFFSRKKSDWLSAWRFTMLAPSRATAFCCLIVAFRSPSRKHVLLIPPPQRRSPSLRGQSLSHKGAVRVYESAARVLIVIKIVIYFYVLVCVLCHRLRASLTMSDFGQFSSHVEIHSKLGINSLTPMGSYMSPLKNRAW
jgi:hypothetical protein